MSTFLGIKIEKRGDLELYSLQPGLIRKVLKAAGMSDCNPSTTPSTLEHLGLKGLSKQRKRILKIVWLPY